MKSGPATLAAVEKLSIGSVGVEQESREPPNEGMSESCESELKFSHASREALGLSYNASQVKTNSSYKSAQISALLEHAKVVPAVNQCDMSLKNREMRLLLALATRR